MLQPLELETDPRSPQESMVMMNRDTDNMLKLSRVGSALANERTLLAWLRTACSMFAHGSGKKRRFIMCLCVYRSRS